MASRAAQIRTTTSDGHLLLGCALTLLVMVERIHRRFEQVDSAIGILASRLSSIVAPISCVFRRPLTFLLCFVDGHLVATEDTVGHLFPPARHLFRKIHKLAEAFLRALPSKAEEAVDVLGWVIACIPFLSRVLERCAALVVWGLQFVGRCWVTGREREMESDAGESDRKVQEDGNLGCCKDGETRTTTADGRRRLPLLLGCVRTLVERTQKRLEQGKGPIGTFATKVSSISAAISCDPHHPLKSLVFSVYCWVVSIEGFVGYLFPPARHLFGEMHTLVEALSRHVPGSVDHVIDGVDWVLARVPLLGRVTERCAALVVWGLEVARHWSAGMKREIGLFEEVVGKMMRQEGFMEEEEKKVGEIEDDDDENDLSGGERNLTFLNDDFEEEEKYWSC